jgi:peptidoglycan biosynthesis protein MviN/MurJ (putative lipid II flippase)
VVRLASGGTAAAEEGPGLTIYAGAMLVVMVPHSIITVSLATALLPRLSRQAAANDLPGLTSTLTDTVRTALVVAIPFAALLPALAMPISQVIWGHGATRDSYDRFVPTLMLFGIGLVFFTIHYLTLRGFYALEQTRTVFLIQCVIAACNVAFALTLVGRTDPAQTAPMLVVAYTLAYAIGSVISFGLVASIVPRTVIASAFLDVSPLPVSVRPHAGRRAVRLPATGPPGWSWSEILGRRSAVREADRGPLSLLDAGAAAWSSPEEDHRHGAAPPDPRRPA